MDDPDILSKPHYKFVFDNMAGSWISPQQIELKKFQPEKFLSKIKCPVLALNGTRDDLVECDKNLNAIKQAVLQGGNSKVTTVAIPNVNHNYRTLQEGPIWNLADKDEIFSNKAFKAISNWLSDNYAR